MAVFSMASSPELNENVLSVKIVLYTIIWTAGNITSK